MKSKKILIIRGGALGDLILTLPVIANIKAHWPESKITVWGRYPHTKLLTSYGIADEISCSDKAKYAKLFTPLGSEIAFNLDYDIAFVFADNSVFIENIRKQGVKKVYYLNPDPSLCYNLHFTDYLLKILNPLNIPIKSNIPCFNTAKKEKQKMLKIAIHPGSGSKNKNWPLENFINISQWISQKYNAKIFFILGEAEEAITKKIKNTKYKIYKNLPIVELAKKLEKCSLYIGNDSGITHLAAALNITTIAIFGPTDPKIWGPKGKNVSIIKSDLSCSPCNLKKIKKCGDIKCLNSISPRKIKTIIKNLLRRPKN